MFINKNLKNLIIVLLFFPVFTFGQSLFKTGTTAAKFLSVEIGPRANAMGGAFTAISNDASAMYWNPAGIGDVTANQGFFSYTKLFADINLSYFGFVVPLEGVGSIGVNVTGLNFGEMEITTELEPEGIGTTFSASSYAFGISFARHITDEFVIGANFKYIRENIFNSYAQGLAVDVGTIFNTPFWGIKFASSISNFGTKMKIEGDDLLVRYDQDLTTSGNNETVDAFLSTDQFELPLRLRIGMSKQVFFNDENSLILAVDANYPNDNKQWVNVGGELSLFNNFVQLRGGYKTLFLQDSQEGLTLGFGINYKFDDSFGIRVDYSYQQLDLLDNNQSFGLLLTF